MRICASLRLPPASNSNTLAMLWGGKHLWINLPVTMCTGQKRAHLWKSRFSTCTRTKAPLTDMTMPAACKTRGHEVSSKALFQVTFAHTTDRNTVPVPLTMCCSKQQASVRKLCDVVGILDADRMSHHTWLGPACAPCSG